MNPEQGSALRRRLRTTAARRRRALRAGKGRCKKAKKTRFPSFDAAAAAALRLSATLGRGIRAYRCEDCDGWHLTRVPRWKDTA